MLQALPLVFVLVGLMLYTVLGGADFGAGFWQLFAGSDGRSERIREEAHHAIGPVWEANHVWLIFALTVFWTTYPTAFGSIASTLAIPLFIAAIGIIFRGAAYGLRPGAVTARESGRIDTVFAVSSILTPFALGAAVGAIATNRVPVGNAAGNMWTSWLNPAAISIGVLAVATSAYLAAVYLAADSARDGDRELEQAFRVRALGAGVAAGAAAAVALVLVEVDNKKLADSLLSGRGLPAVIVSALAGAATLALVYRRRYEPARYGAALAVAAVVAGWALGRWPTILPGLTVDQAAAGHDTLVAVVVVVLAGGLIVFPALAYLFRLELTGRFAGAEESTSTARGESRPYRLGPRLLVRTAAACLVVGFGFLTVANAPWAHVIGVLALLAFIPLAFCAIVFPLAAEPEPFT